MMRPPPKPRAFTLPELLAAGVVVGVTIALLVLMGGRSRKLGQCGESMANLRQIGALTGSHGADSQDRMWGYTWRPNTIPADVDADVRALGENGSFFGAASAQAIHIIRRRGNDPSFPILDVWFPHVLYNTLPLIEYAGTPAPARWVLSPGDRNRVNWASDIPGFRRGIFGANQPPGDGSVPDPSEWRWSYSSSYDLSYAFYAPDSGDTVTQGAVHYLYQAPTNRELLAPRRLTEVVYPSQKAMMWDTYGWYYGSRVEFATMVGARVPVLFSDGSVQVRARTRGVYPEGCQGWNPRLTSLPFPMTFMYEPRSWEPRVPSGASSVQVTGYQRWTRWGLRGRDFDGPEVLQP